MATSSCPSCGAPVRFRAAASVVAVCEYCRSTLLRKDTVLENIGRMADLVEDDSPLQLGTQGRYRGATFSLAGRLQYRHAAGAWNEWYLLFDDGRTGWLSDAMGQFVVTLPRKTPVLPALDALRLGQSAGLDGKRYEVTGIEQAQVVSGEGELPFRVGPGWEGTFVDLRGEDGRFATLDYSGGQPVLYAGEEKLFEAFHFANLRDPRRSAAKEGTARTFSCTGCGAPLTRRVRTSEAVACASCGAVIDVNDPDLAIISRVEEHAAGARPEIPLGSRGRLAGGEYEVIGYLRRSMRSSDGARYHWAEYLLHDPERGFRWLGEYAGHYTLSKALGSAPPVSNDEQAKVRHLGKTFLHFQAYTATVEYLAGEFFWRVQVGDQNQVDDFVDPPLLLSRERDQKEVTWTLGEYVEPQVLERAFRLASPLPARHGVAPNQPSPHQGEATGYWLWFALFAGIATMIHVVMRMVSGGTELVTQSFLHEGSQPRTEIVSRSFEVAGTRVVPLTVQSRAGVNNGWVYLDMALVNEKTGDTWRMGREISVYSGYDGGEYWSEGNDHDTARLASVPPGRYHLEIEVEGDRSIPRVAGTIRIARDPPDLTNLLIALALLAALPVFMWSRGSSFEARRWAGSDHAPDDADSADGD